MDIQLANYIIDNFHSLLDLNDVAALKYQHFLRNRINEYKMEVAEKLLKEKPEKIYFNNCPLCGKLARTAYAKQCRFCKHDWH